MKMRRQIAGVLGNTLSAFASRYSDYDGYWLFGILITRADHFTFNIVGENPAERDDPVVAAAFYRGRNLFFQQLEKAQLPVGFISSASISLEKSSITKLGPVNHHAVLGHDVTMSARAVSDLGKVYRSTKLIFVARHDPAIELRSVRG
ncbi:hypothetical protein CMV30_11585 [Nibricoccus aquaticus]|uniref:Uncharacterized protein n=1 Tax=Nibricoccus aquaticus TaxID=2576891 RepID=A0A290Q7Y5_9BACT|nr:hypothetical protein [Nibricoccus aquaticus]ATC64543.1 hypothetical protein CMV30_11585 [Nibricoccus aquaticus]